MSTALKTARKEVLAELAALDADMRRLSHGPMTPENRAEVHEIAQEIAVLIKRLRRDPNLALRTR